MNIKKRKTCRPSSSDFRLVELISSKAIKLFSKYLFKKNIALVTRDF